MPHSVACLDLRVIALLEAKRAGLLRRAHWLPNIVSGLIVGVVALPRFPSPFFLLSFPPPPP
ncbi:hypothetical protein, partial [Bordetella pertussis]|uniref:hypothetical protein n=1 Tax=Bordetella pertussis TaxID=520 RepID=UPI0036700EA4